MSEANIIIRRATADDAGVIAQAVAMAIGDEKTLCSYCGKEYLPVLQEIACAERTQYSWRSAFVAEVDGATVGAIVGYDGAQLEELRANTFAIIERCVGFRPSVANETEAGEYYLDSVGVKPEFRGMGIGRRLISALCDEAFRQGHERVGLIVESNNTKAQTLYSSVGFRCVGEREFFSHMMWHMQIEQNFSSNKFAKSLIDE